MNDIDKGKMYQELLDAAHVPVREDYPQPNMTIAEYAKEKEIDHKVAYNALERAVRLGRLERAEEDVLIGSRWCALYWKVDRDVL